MRSKIIKDLLFAIVSHHQQTFLEDLGWKMQIGWVQGFGWLHAHGYRNLSLALWLIFSCILLVACGAPRLPDLQRLDATTVADPQSSFRDRLDWSSVFRRDADAPGDVHVPETYALQASDVVRLSCRRASAMLSLYNGGGDDARSLLRGRPELRVPLALIAAIQTIGVSCDDGVTIPAVSICRGGSNPCLPPAGTMTWGNLEARFARIGVAAVLEPSESHALFPGDTVTISYDYVRRGERDGVLGPFGRDMQSTVDAGGMLAVPLASRSPHAQGVDPRNPDFYSLAVSENQSVRVHTPGLCHSQQSVRLGSVATCLNILPLGADLPGAPFDRAVVSQCAAMGLDTLTYADPNPSERSLLSVFRLNLNDPVFYVVTRDGTRHAVPFVEGLAITPAVANAVEAITGRAFLYPATEFGAGGFLTVQPAASGCAGDATPFYFRVRDRSGPEVGPVRLRRGDTVFVSIAEPLRIQ